MILLDEIEKAHSEVFDVLLQVLDDGRLTDGQGRTVDFRNAVLIMTSNIRSADALRDHFRPEFLNRVDEIVEFKPITREQLGEIVELQLGRLRERLAERGLSLELTRPQARRIVEAGLGPDLRRAAAEACDSAAAREPARPAAARRRLRRRRHDRRRRARTATSSSTRRCLPPQLHDTVVEPRSNEVRGLQRRGGSATSSSMSAPSWRGGAP